MRTVQPIDSNGSSEWLVLGAVVIAASREPEVVGWAKQIRDACWIVQKQDLHFRDMNRFQKTTSCRMLANFPVRCFALCSNKKNMKGYRNVRAEQRVSTQEWFYNSCVKYLLERITEFVEKKSHLDFGKPKHLKLIFSHRGGMRYSQTVTYHDLIKNQARAGLTFHTKREVKPEVMHPNLITSVPHLGNAGPQLADIVTSAFYCAAHARDPKNHFTTPAEILKPVMWGPGAEERIYADNGVTLMPHVAIAKLSAEQEQIFRYFGYQF